MPDEKKAESLDLGAKKLGALPPMKAAVPVKQAGPHAEHARQHITAEKLSTMSVPEIRAVATDRGYELGQAMGRSATALAFAKAQEKDESGLHKA